MDSTQYKWAYIHIYIYIHSYVHIQIYIYIHIYQMELIDPTKSTSSQHTWTAQNTHELHKTHMNRTKHTWTAQNTHELHKTHMKICTHSYIHSYIHTHSYILGGVGRPYKRHQLTIHMNSTQYKWAYIHMNIYTNSYIHIQIYIHIHIYQGELVDPTKSTSSQFPWTAHNTHEHVYTCINKLIYTYTFVSIRWSW